MNFSGLPRLLLERWYLTLSGLACTIGLCLLATSYVPASYQAHGDVLLLPAAKSVGPGGNPYLELSGLSQAADVLARSLSDSTTADALKRESVSGTYTVVRDPTTDSPMLLVTSKNRTPATALSTLNRVVALAGPTMQRIQVAIAVPAPYLITTRVLTMDSKASPVRKNQIRAAAASIAIGLLLSVLGIAGIARLADRRLQRRTQRVLENANILHRSAASDTSMLPSSDIEAELGDAMRLTNGGQVRVRERQGTQRRDG